MMKTGIALAITHWAVVFAWGFWGWAGFWSVVAAGAIIIDHKREI